LDGLTIHGLQESQSNSHSHHLQRPSKLSDSAIAVPWMCLVSYLHYVNHHVTIACQQCFHHLISPRTAPGRNGHASELHCIFLSRFTPYLHSRKEMKFPYGYLSAVHFVTKMFDYLKVEVEWLSDEVGYERFNINFVRYVLILVCGCFNICNMLTVFPDIIFQPLMSWACLLQMFSKGLMSLMSVLIRNMFVLRCALSS
jgi:hypothetical protein